MPSPATPADSANPLVLAKDMQVKLRFLPLFLGRLQPAKITLDSPVITIVREADGRYNYEPQGGKESRRQTEPTEAISAPMIARYLPSLRCK